MINGNKIFKTAHLDNKRENNIGIFYLSKIGKLQRLSHQAKPVGCDISHQPVIPALATRRGGARRSREDAKSRNPFGGKAAAVLSLWSLEFSACLGFRA
ncbi:MAG: hypothetical protein KAR47_15160 [Planctomycetes bacterium]|nr:hypothetical protein [Planctomycetota bacterium]